MGKDTKMCRSTGLIWLSPLCTLLIFALFYAWRGIWPLGDRAIAWCDMEQQTIPLLAQCKDIFEGAASFSYSSAAGGMNFLGVFFFFCASPFTFLVVLVPKAMLLLFMNVLVPLKLAACAFTAALYFRKFSLGRGLCCLFSLMYAFGGYGLFYYQNLVWLDMLWLFPLLLLALDALLRPGQVLPYVLCFSAAMIIQYYLTYMVVLFLILASSLYLLCHGSKETRGRIALQFALGSIIGVLLTTVVWLPCLLQYLESARGGSLLQSLQQASMTHTVDKASLLLCTCAALAILPIAFCKKTGNTSLRWLTVLLLAAVFIEPVNLMWHTGSYQAFPLRYGYMPVLCGLTLGAAWLSNVRYSQTSKRSVLAALSVCVGLQAAAVAGLRIWGYEEISSYTSTLWVHSKSFLLLLIPAVCALLCYGLCYYCAGTGSLSKRGLMLFFALSFGCETILNLTVYLDSAAVKDTLYAQTMTLDQQLENPDGYRVKQEKKYAHVNMLSALGWNTLAHYTSLTQEDFLYAMKKLGYSSYWMEVGSNGGTVLTDALLSVGYSVGQSSDFSEDAVIAADCGVLKIAETPCVLPLGLLCDAQPEDLQKLPYNGSRMETQAALAEQMLGIRDFVVSYEPTSTEGVCYSKEAGITSVSMEPDADRNEIRYSLYIGEKQMLYFDLFDQISTSLREEVYESVRVYVNGKQLTSAAYPSQIENGIVELGCFEQRYVSVCIKVCKEFDASSFGVFGIQMDALEQAVQQADGVMLTQEGNTFQGSCNADTDCTLSVGLAWSSGYEAYVNGKEVPVSKIQDCFIAIPLQAGSNEIVLEFHAPGQRIGLVFTVCGAVWLLIWCLIRRRTAPPKALCRIAWYALMSLFGLVLLLVYAVPIAVSVSQV